MSEALKLAIAQLFRKKGQSSMPEKDFVFAASLDFRWFVPKDAQKFLELGLESELLTLEDGKVKPTFDHRAVDIPPGYKPDQEILKAEVKPKGLLLKIVDDISLARKMQPKDVIASINQMQDRMGVDVEVAALVVAHSEGMDVSGYLGKVEEEIGARYRGAVRSAKRGASG